MKKEKITQQDVWKSQKRLYDLIYATILGFFTAIGIIAIFLLLAIIYDVFFKCLLFPKSLGCPGGPAIVAGPEPLTEADYLRMLVQFELMNSNYKPVDFLLWKHSGKQFPRNLTKEQIMEMIDLESCVIVDWSSAKVEELPPFFYLENYTFEDIESYSIWCKELVR